jgi:EAL domain-containing protein (putative c-di-GMP-specific phosphodiesterase class I)
VALESSVLEGFEALVRWRHPRLGLLSSGQFIPFTEPTEVIQLLTCWVVRSALEQLALWNRRLPRLSMAINLSMRNVHDPICMERLAEIIRTVGVDPGVVEFELTETAIMTDPEGALKALGRITSSGARLALDDFGTGYASLAYLKRLPVDVIKIDQSFVAEVVTDSSAAAVLSAIVHLAHVLGFEVIAEGAETPQQIDALRTLDCDYIQGFYYAQPAPPSTTDIIARYGLPESAPVSYAGVSER